MPRTKLTNFKVELQIGAEKHIAKVGKIYRKPYPKEKYELMVVYDRLYSFETAQDEPLIYQKIKKSLLAHLDLYAPTRLKEFLNYHYENCTNSKKDFIRELRTVILVDFKDESKVEFIKDWIRENQNTDIPINKKGFKSKLEPTQIVSILHSENIIIERQKIPFETLIINSKIYPLIKWHDSDWKLYLLIEFLSTNSTLTLLENQKIEHFCIQFFTNSEGKELKTIKQNYNRAKNNFTFEDYSTKLNNIFNN